MQRKIRILGTLLAVLLFAVLSGRISAYAGEGKTAEDFADIPQDYRYYAEVDYVVTNGYFRGVSETEFAPNGEMTRGMFATVLWRYAGSPDVSGTNPFQDVRADKYYAKPILWAKQNGIVSGITDALFDPDSSVTRRDAAVMLYRYAERIFADTTAHSGCAASFADGDRVPEYARPSLEWAITHGIIVGMNQKGFERLLSSQTIKRYQVALFLWRFHHYITLNEPVPKRVPKEASPPRKTETLWINGIKIDQAPIWNNKPYICAAGLNVAANGQYCADGNIYLRIFGHRILVSKTEKYAMVDGKTKALDAASLYYQGEWYIPAYTLLRSAGFASLVDKEQNQIFFTQRPKHADVPKGCRVPILMYHCVSDDIWGIESLFTSPAVLEQQIIKMKELGCTFITFEDMGQADRYGRPVMLTFDDGYLDNYTELLPILKRQRVKATVFVVSGFIGGARYLSEAQIREMSDSGFVSIQSHTHNHSKDLCTETEDELRFDLSKSQLILARITGKIPFAVSYPRGHQNQTVRQITAEYYQFGLLANTAGPWITGDNWYAMERYGMYRDTTMEALASYVAP